MLERLFIFLMVIFTIGLSTGVREGANKFLI